MDLSEKISNTVGGASANVVLNCSLTPALSRRTGEGVFATRRGFGKPGLTHHAEGVQHADVLQEPTHEFLTRDSGWNGTR